jgi:hypothetical protein
VVVRSRGACGSDAGRSRKCRGGPLKALARRGALVYYRGPPPVPAAGLLTVNRAMNRNLKGKSYNEVMNEWAAQKHFLTRATGSLLRPGHNVTGGARIMAWFWRFLLFLGLPLLAYMGWLKIHGKSADFTSQLAAETKKFLGAEKVELKRAQWDLNGGLRVEHMAVTGAPHNVFSSITASNLDTSIPLPRVLRSRWELEKLGCSKAVIALRSGSAPRVAFTAQSPALLTAGYGLSPDFSRLSVSGYHCEDLTLTWGSTPSTTGSISGAKAVMKRAGEDIWDLTLEGGDFSQCWLDGLRISRAALRLGKDRVEISRGDFSVPGGGSGTLTGSITTGEHPEIEALVKMENLQMHRFLLEYFRSFVEATGQGTVKLSGSTNRNTGVLMNADFAVQSGSLHSIPVLRALETATSEGGLSAPEITGGRLRFTSKGTAEPGGYVIESQEISLDCGTRLKVGFSVHHERKQLMAANYREAVKSLDKSAAESVSLSTKGTFSIGLPAATAAKLKTTIRQEFISREEQGLQWMDISFTLEEGGDFTRTACDRITALHFAGQ